MKVEIVSDLLKSIKEVQLNAAECAVVKYLEASELVPKKEVDKIVDVTAH